MKNRIIFIVSLVLFFINLRGFSAIASINDYGTKEYKQPNGVTFIAWSFSDEFGAYLQTLDGFMITKNQKDSYYYYQTINKSGEFVVTNFKVMIDDPVKKNIRKYLLSTEEWKNKAYKKNIHMLNKSINKTNTLTTCTLKVILVEFSDIKHSDYRYWPMDTTQYGTARANYVRYTKTHFTNMISSYNTYNTTSPDGDQVYGSMNDYYKDMSNNSLSFVAQVVNLDSDGYPIWVNLGATKRSYMKPASGVKEQIWLDAISYLNTQQGVSVTADQNTKIVVIYAGNMYGTPAGTDSIGLNPRLIEDNGQNAGYVMSERAMTQSLGPNSENAATFAHIGTHCHEFGHVLGLFDYYQATNDWHKYWTLMAQGNDKGSSGVRGNCPSPISPIDRNYLGWLTYTQVKGKHINYPMVYSIDNAYQIGDPAILSDPALDHTQTEYYVIENRLTTGQDWNRFLPNSGLLIWRYFWANNDSPASSSNYNMYLLRANGNKFGADHSDSDPFPGSLNVTKINDFTSGTDTKYFLKKYIQPNPNISGYDSTWWVNSNVQLSNISNSGSTMTADISTYWYGTLSESQTWSGEVKIGEDLTIPSGVTLTLNPGTKLIFSTGVRLIVNGMLNATGTSSNRITFTSTSSSTTWGGILFTGTGTGYPALSYCNIEHVNGSAITVNNYSGVPQISNCNITNNSTGLRIDNGNGYLAGSVIENCTSAVEVDNSGYIYFGLSSAGSFSCTGTKNNRIRSNTNGVYCGNQTTSYLGNVEDAILQGNCLYNNSNYNLDVDLGSSIYANNIYWGATPGEKIILEGGTLRCSTYCTTAPLNNYKEKTPEFISEGLLLKKAGYSVNNSTPIEDIAGRQMRGDYKGAFEEYKKLIGIEAETGGYDEVYLGLLSLFRESKMPEVLEYLEGLSVKAINPLLETCIANCYAVTDKTDIALSKYDYIIKNYPKTRYSLMSNAQKFYHYYFTKGDKSSAGKIFDEMKIDYKDEKIINYLASLLEKNDGLKKESDQNQKDNTISKPTTPAEFSLTNYPNPFNPSTVIRYSIPKDLHVKLVVYDVTGKEVKILVDEVKSAGAYNVEFNAGNYASGVYYYKMEAGDYKNIRKMVLVK